MSNQSPADKKRIASLKAGIEAYTGKKVTDIKVVEDPKVEYTFAIRSVVEEFDHPIDFIIVGQNLDVPISKATPEVIADNLEECEFKTWPPASGTLKFF